MLGALAVVLGRRRGRPVPRTGDPGLVRTAVVALVLATLYAMVPQTWLGVAGSLILLGLGGVLLRRAATNTAWSATHAAVVGAAPLIATAALAFTYDPLIGEVSTAAKYGHNVVMLAIVLAALGVALLRRDRRVADTEYRQEQPIAP
jgi:hypothetical protein